MLAHTTNPTPETRESRNGNPLTNSRISEIILAGADSGMTLAMIAHLSHQYKHDGRWLTWICSTQVGRSALAQYNFDLNGLRILIPTANYGVSDLMHKALRAGTSHTVVAYSTDTTLDMNSTSLTTSAHQGDCSGLIIHPQTKECLKW